MPQGAPGHLTQTEPPAVLPCVSRVWGRHGKEKPRTEVFIEKPYRVADTTPVLYDKEKHSRYNAEKRCKRCKDHRSSSSHEDCQGKEEPVTPVLFWFYLFGFPDAPLNGVRGPFQPGRYNSFFDRLYRVPS